MRITELTVDGDFQNTRPFTNPFQPEKIFLIINDTDLRVCNQFVSKYVRLSSWVASQDFLLLFVSRLCAYLPNILVPVHVLALQMYKSIG